MRFVIGFYDYYRWNVGLKSGRVELFRCGTIICLIPARLKEKKRISVTLRKKLASMRKYGNLCRMVESVGNSCCLFWQRTSSSRSLSFNPGALDLTSLLWVKTLWQTTLGKQAFHCPIWSHFGFILSHNLFKSLVSSSKHFMKYSNRTLFFLEDVLML